MAYARRRTTGRTYQRRSTGTRTRGSGYAKSSRRRSTSGRVSRPQTVRIELVGLQGSAVSRSPIPQALMPKAPRKSKY